jgi:hypothetical protein
VLGHNEAALDDSRGNCVEGAEVAVPLRSSVVHGHDVQLGGLFQANKLRQEASWEGVAAASRGEDQGGRRGGGRAR